MDVTLKHRGIEVTILEGPYLQSGQPTPDAVRCYSDLVDRLDEIGLFAADQMLELYNTTWLNDEIGVLDRRGFADRLCDPKVQLFDTAGSAVVTFSDGDMFAGHWIQVTTQDGVPKHAELIG